MKQKVRAFFRRNYIILVILIIASFLRLYNFPFRYYLGDETVREAIIGLEGARTLQAPLIGSFSSAGPFTWGPWFYYQMILASLAIPFSYAPWLYLTFLSILSVFLLYKIGRELEDKYLGCILAGLGAISPAMIISSTHLTFPNLLDSFALFSIFISIKLIKKDLSKYWWLLFGFILGISVNLHPQAAGLIFLSFVLFIYYLIMRKSILHFRLFILGFAITFMPLLVFELTNHWFNFRNITYYYLHGKNAIYVPNRWLFYLRDFWPAYWSDVIGVSVKIGWLIMTLSGLSLFHQFLRIKNYNRAFIFLLVVFLINFVALRYYWGPRFFGYFVYLRPFVILFTGYVLYWIITLSKSFKLFYLGISGVILFCFFIIVGNRSLFMKDRFTTDMYSQTDVLKKTLSKQSFQLYICPASGNSFYAGVVKSSLFLLDKDKRLDDNGGKLGINGDSCLDPSLLKNLIFEDEKDMATVSGRIKDEKVIPNTDFVNLEEFSDEELEKAKWTKYSFKSVYDSSVRWWMDEKP